MKSLAIVLALAACDKDDAPAGDTGSAGSTDTKKEPAPESAARKALLEAWKKAGLTTTEMKTASAFGNDCQGTTVNNIDVVMCEHPNADSAKKAEAEALVWIGNTTGAAWTTGTLVIAAADRKKADVNGKTINSLMKSTPK